MSDPAPQIPAAPRAPQTSAYRSDLRLAAQAANGDPVSVRTILMRIAVPVRNVAWNLVHDHHEAEDLAQEALLRISQPRVLSGYRGDGPLDAYLRRVAVREMISRRRAGELRTWRDRIVLADGVPERSDRSHGDEPALLAPNLRTAIEALPERAREVVVLIVLGELSYEETADATGLKLGTVRSTYHRARAQLADTLRTSSL